MLLVRFKEFNRVGERHTPSRIVVLRPRGQFALVGDKILITQICLKRFVSKADELVIAIDDRPLAKRLQLILGIVTPNGRDLVQRDIAISALTALERKSRQQFKRLPPVPLQFRPRILCLFVFAFVPSAQAAAVEACPSIGQAFRRRFFVDFNNQPQEHRILCDRLSAWHAAELTKEFPGLLAVRKIALKITQPVRFVHRLDMKHRQLKR